MNKWHETVQKHRKLICGITFAFTIFFSCFTFPFYNFTHQWSKYTTFINLPLTIMAFSYMGISEAWVLPEFSTGKVVLLNVLLVLLGMSCRYLLEFGEVSNTYNFTPLNSIVHIGVAVATITLAWYIGKSKYYSETEG